MLTMAASTSGEGATEPRLHPGQELCSLQTEVGTHTSELGSNRQRRWTRRDEIGWVFKAHDAGPGGATIEARIVYVRFRFESDVTAFDRDTRRPESFVAGENGAEPEFPRLVDRPITIALDANNRVTKVTGADEMLAELGESVQLRMGHMMSAEAIRHWPMFAEAGAPAGASAGATWSDRFATDVDFVWVPPSDVQASYHLKIADDKHTEVEVAYSVTPKPPPPTTRPGIADPPQLESEWKGMLTFDRGTGLLIKAVSTLQAKTRQTFFGNINSGSESNVTFTFEQVDRSVLELPAVATASQPAGSGIDLGTRFQPGEALDYRIVESVHANLRADTGPDQPIFFFREMGLSLSADKVGPDGSAELDISFLSPNSESLRVMALPQGSPQTLPEADAPVVPGLTLNQYEQEPRHTVNSMLRRLPLFAGATAPNPVAVGARWGDAAEIVVPLIGKVAVDTQYELKGVDPAKQTAQLGIVQELTLMEAAGGAALATVDYTGKLTGTAEWDLARGHCIGAHLTGKVTDIRKTATGEAVSIEETVELTMQRVRLAMPQNHGRDARATP